MKGEAGFSDDALLRTLADSLEEGLLILDACGRIVFWNKGAEKTFGCSEGELIGRNAVDLLALEPYREEYAERCKRFLKTGIKTKDLESTEFFARNRDGDTVVIEVNVSRMELAGSPYLIVVIRDVASRKAAERALQESDARFKLLESNLTDIIWMADLELKLNYISPSVSHQTGFTVEEVLGKTIGDLITPDSMERALRRREEELAKAEETFVDPPIPVGLVVQQLRKDGTTFWSEVRTGFLRRPDGTPYGILGVSRDISERVLLEEKERERAAAQAAAEVSAGYAAELKDIITIAAHELRLPATVFKGYSKVLLEHRERLDEAAVDKALAEIDAASVHLNNMVGDLFETSLIEQKKVRLRRELISPPCLLRQAAEGMNPRRPSCGLRIRPGEPEYAVEADRERVCRVLRVLMDNAVKYSPQGSPVDAWFEQDDEETRFCVLDRGPGVPEAEREKVFARFYQAGNADHHPHAGLGLGLYIARSIVEEHGGWIRVEPGGAGGSLFSFGLPRLPGDPATGRAAGEEPLLLEAPSP